MTPEERQILFGVWLEARHALEADPWLDLAALVTRLRAEHSEPDPITVRRGVAGAAQAIGSETERFGDELTAALGAPIGAAGRALFREITRLA